MLLRPWALRAVAALLVIPACAGTLTYRYVVVAPGALPPVIPLESPGVDLRAGPGSPSIVGRLPDGSVVVPSEGRAGWIRVTAEKSPALEGWVLEKLLEKKAVVATPQPTEGFRSPLPPLSWDAAVGTALASAVGGLWIALSGLRMRRR